jgi:hypothetical protein
MTSCSGGSGGSAPLNDERFGEAVLLLARQGPQALATGLVPEQIASPWSIWWKVASWRCRPSPPAFLFPG